MSVRVSSWVWHEAPVTGRSDLLVLLALADHASDDGSGAYPSIGTLATKARLSRRAVFDSLARLKAAQLIVPEGSGPRGQVAYRICMGVQTLHGATSAPVQKSPPGGADSARGGADSRTKGVQQAAPEPEEEPSDEPSSTSRPGARGGRGRAASPEFLAVDGVGELAVNVAGVLQRGIDGLTTDEPVKPASAVEVLRVLQEQQPPAAVAWAVAVDAREIVQAQNRAPNVVGLYAQKLRKALEAEVTAA